MSDIPKWRIALLSPNDVKCHDDFIVRFQQAYEANNQPGGMAMFSHTDSQGVLMAISVSPESVSYCEFTEGWDEPEVSPTGYGHLGFVAGDERWRR